MAYKKTGIPENNAEDLEVGEYKMKLNKPSKQAVFLAFKSLASPDGSVDLLKSGEVIFDTCAVGYDSEIVEDVQVFMSLCLKLAEWYVTPSEMEIKKKVSTSIKKAS